MKKTLSILSIIVLGLVLNSGALSQERAALVQQTKRIPFEALSSDVFNLNRINLLDRNGELQLRFSIANRKIQSYPGFTVVLNAYFKNGGLKARSVWKTNEEVVGNSVFSSVFHVFDGFLGASRYTVQFLAPSGGASLTGEVVEDCTACTNNAIAACGAGKVKSMSCQMNPDGSYSCEFECKGELIE